MSQTWLLACGLGLKVSGNDNQAMPLEQKVSMLASMGVK